MANKDAYSPLLVKYLRAYEKNPNSRVFAPLGETYRKMGMVDKAIEVLREGLRQNPAYVMGNLGLAFCYFDQKQYQLAFNILQPLVGSNRDNLRMQKLFAEVCRELGSFNEALETYKYLLFINPKDKYVAQQVHMLEDSSLVTRDYNTGAESEILFEATEKESVDEDDSVYRKDVAEFEIDKIKAKPDGESMDEWTQVNLSDGSVEQEYYGQKSEDLEYVQKQSQEIFNIVDKSNESGGGKPRDSFGESAPVITHTLVDLYCAQGHVYKAIEVLEKIIELNPNDQKSLNKLIEIKKIIPQEEIDAQANDIKNEELLSEEDEDREEFMDLLDSKLGRQKEVKAKGLEKRFSSFLSKIQERANSVSSR